MSQVRVLYPPPQWRISSVGRAPIKDLNLCLGKFLIYRQGKSKNSRSLKTKTNVRLADLKVSGIRVCWNWHTSGSQKPRPQGLRVQVSSPGPLYPAWRLGEEKPVSIPSWVFVQATTLNKQPAGSSLLLAKLLRSKYRKSGAESRHYHPPQSRLHRHKEEAARTEHWEPLSPTKYTGPQLIWESACLASRRWRVRASLGPP